MKQLILLAVLAVGACVETVPPVSTPPAAPLPPAGPPISAAATEANFAAVVARMEPMIERECRIRRSAANCDFQIVVDARPGQPPNARQSLDRSGRPIIAFSTALIRDARNIDEIAFVMGHEAAHHIAGHIPRQKQSALTGAMIFGALTAASGADGEAIRNAQDLGGTIGARRFSKDFELEADALGTVLTWDAGFDPERGAAFFARIPDPGNRFLGTHPPNAARIETVRKTLVTLR